MEHRETFDLYDNKMDREELIRLAKLQYPGIKEAHIELLIDDYIKRPEFYDDLCTGNIEEPIPLDRDTVDSIGNNVNIVAGKDNCYINIDERD